jgi:alkylhydroperoxidase/carboxymuconolactone decarboxylase family protein YurZ
MNRYDYDHITLDIETIQKQFENKFLPSDEVFENGELDVASAENFFDDYYKDYDKIFKSNSLSERTKSLIAFAVASAMYSPYCMNVYCNDVFENGWNEEQVTEAIEIVAAVRSGFASVHVVKKLNEKEARTK